MIDRSHLSLGLIAMMAAAPMAAAEVALLGASLNATLYESSTGGIANGAGEWFFAGMNNQGQRRRGLISFDLAAFADGIEGDIVVNSVALTLSLSQGGGAATMIDFHRVTTAWGEGTSDASGNEGGGAPATPGSATWLHTFYAESFWTNPGGDFLASVSGSLSLGENGVYSVSSEGMRQDVAAWITGASENFGWILLGDETQFGTARRFDSSRNAVPEGRPVLLIDYSVVPAPATVLALLGLAPAARPRRRRA